MRVSVIIPAYNAEKTLERCVLSILNQEYPVYEIIIINDGSTDNTQKCCDKLLRVYNKIIVLTQGNKGVSIARNNGLDRITGEYVVFIDSDDIIEPNYIKTLMSSCEFDFVLAGFNMQDKEGLWHSHIFTDEVVTIDYLRKFPSHYMGKYYFGGPLGKLFKRKIIEKYNIRFIPNIQSGEDTLFIFEYLSHVNNIRILPLSGYKYYFYESSLAHKFHEDYWKWKIVVEKEIQNFFNPLDTVEKQYLLCRNFDILKDLLQKYDNDNIRNRIVSNPLFEKCIKFKRKNGTLEEKFLVCVIERNQFMIYIKYLKMKKFLIRCRKYIKRNLHI